MSDLSNSPNHFEVIVRIGQGYCMFHLHKGILVDPHGDKRMLYEFEQALLVAEEQNKKHRESTR